MLVGVVRLMGNICITSPPYAVMLFQCFLDNKYCTSIADISKLFTIFFEIMYAVTKCTKHFGSVISTTILSIALW